MQIERSLAHTDRNAVRGTYNRASYWQERVDMHQWWSSYLDQLRDGGEVIQHGSSSLDAAENVVDLASRRQRYQG